MKKLLHLSIFILAILLFVACNRNAGTNGLTTYADTTGLSEFQKWKANHELKEASIYDQMGNKVVYKKPATEIRSYTPAPASTSLSSTGEYPAKTSEKKGWSRRAKGAVIGGGSGAIIGALIGKKNRLVGGAIGGALGAGMGYVVGNELDKKHGR